MEEILNKSLEERIVELVNQIDLLVNRRYLDELEASLRSKGPLEEAKESSLYHHRKDIAETIYQPLMNIDVNGEVLSKIMEEMFDQKDRAFFLERVNFFHQQIQLLPTG